MMRSRVNTKLKMIMVTSTTTVLFAKLRRSQVASEIFPSVFFKTSLPFFAFARK